MNMKVKGSTLHLDNSNALREYLNREQNISFEEKLDLIKSTVGPLVDETIESAALTKHYMSFTLSDLHRQLDESDPLICSKEPLHYDLLVKCYEAKAGEVFGAK